MFKIETTKGGTSSLKRFVWKNFLVERNTKASKNRNGNISLPWQPRCQWNVDHNKFSSLYNTADIFVECQSGKRLKWGSIFPKTLYDKIQQLHSAWKLTDGTRVLCKLTFSKKSRCRVTSNSWDFAWEIKFWGLRTLKTS